MLLNSPGFPTYPTSNQKCSRDLTADPGMTLRVYVLAALFKGNQNKYLKIQFINKILILMLICSCNASEDYLSVSDCTQSYQLCGNANTPAFILESVSSNVTVKYSATGLAVSDFMTQGFKLYVEGNFCSF
jgi:hypothetical protein